MTLMMNAADKKQQHHSSFSTIKLLLSRFGMRKRASLTHFQLRKNGLTLFLLLVAFVSLLLLVLLPFIHHRNRTNSHKPSFEHLADKETAKKKTRELLQRLFIDHSPKQLSPEGGMMAPKDAIPWYFDRWSQSLNVSDLLEDYAEWHTEQLSKIQAIGCHNPSSIIHDSNKVVYQDKEETSRRLPANTLPEKASVVTAPSTASPPTAAADSTAAAAAAALVPFGDVIVFRPWESSGLANVMIGVASSFIVALMSGNVFMHNWQGHYYCNAGAHQLFTNPSINGKSMEWSYMSFYANHPSLQMCTPNPKTRGDNVRHYRKSYELTHRKDQSIPAFQYLKCLNLARELHGWSEFRSNQYFTNLIRENSFMNELEHIMFPDGDAYGVVSRFLFQPLPHIAQKTADFIQQNDILVPSHLRAELPLSPDYKGRYKMVGLQIRRNEKERSIKWFVESEEKFFWDCANSIVASWTDGYRVLVMSDNATTIQNTKERFPDGVAISYPQELTFSRSVVAVQNALVDIMLLSYSHAQVVSKMSTFGNVGHGRASNAPWVVQRMGSQIGKCICYQQKSSEPDFHWQRWLKEIGCPSSWFG